MEKNAEKDYGKEYVSKQKISRGLSDTKINDQLTANMEY